MTTEIKSAKERIKDYLDERACKDELFAKSYAKSNKNIDECYDYIVGEARKQCKDSDSICISDDVVYGWAVHYYDEDNIMVGKSTESKESKESNVNKKAVEANKMASNANKKASEAKKKSADAKKSKPAKIQQLTLFDLSEL